jgi:hypothetical protein
LLAKINRGTPASSFSYVKSIAYSQEFLELLARLLDPLGVGGVDNVDEGVVLFEVVGPVLAQGLLSSDIPHVQLELVVAQVFNVEALRWGDRRDILHRFYVVLRWRGPSGWWSSRRCQVPAPGSSARPSCSCADFAEC